MWQSDTTVGTIEHQFHFAIVCVECFECVYMDLYGRLNLRLWAITYSIDPIVVFGQFFSFNRIEQYSSSFMGMILLNHFLGFFFHCSSFGFSNCLLSKRLDKNGYYSLMSAGRKLQLPKHTFNETKKNEENEFKVQWVGASTI